MPEARVELPLRIFLSYSHKDDELREKFLSHLSPLRQDGLIDAWHDRRITAGAEWAGAIDEHLNSADIIILLVSADFLNSSYCNDVEMTRALERRKAGEARVVAVILRPCAWKTSRFAGLQALPKDGKPVVDWPTDDHGFLDAVEGLRKLIEELTGLPPPVPVPVPIPPIRIPRHFRLWAGGLAFCLVLLVGWRCWSKSQQYLRRGTDLLNIGRYADARRELEQAKKWNPLSSLAGCGLKVVELDAIRTDPEQFTAGLAEADREFPRCAYLKVLTGEQKYDKGDFAGALDDFQDAVKREPRLAEAYFDMGLTYDAQKKPDEALVPSETACGLSHYTPRYCNNLADLYFRQGNYPKAKEWYGKTEQHPNSRLELAKIYRLEGNLPLAAEREEEAIHWLNEPSAPNEQQNVWLLDRGVDQTVELSTINEKQCYAELELAVTNFLRKGDEGIAARAVAAAFEKCSSRREEVKGILKWELRRLSTETKIPQMPQRADDFADKFLGGRYAGPTN